MPFREKCAWVSLLLLLGIYGQYYWILSGVIAAGQTETFAYGEMLISRVVLLIVLEIAVAIVFAVWNPKEADAARDEREKLISLKSTRNAYTVALIGASAVLIAMAYDQPDFFTINGLFLAIVLAEAVHDASQIFYFRRGA